MSLALNIVEQVLLAGSLVLFIGLVVRQSLTEVDSNERLRRVAALAAGALVAVGAQQAGLTYATFTVKSLSHTRVSTAGAEVVAAIIPGLMGAGIGFLMTRKFRSSQRVAMRLMSFVAMLSATAFLQVYIHAANKSGVALGATAIPNIAFVAGILVAYILIDDQKKKAGKGAMVALTESALRRLIRRKSDSADAPATALDPFRRDPFSR